MENRCREEGIRLADEFIVKLRTGEIREASRPNSGRDYTGAYEQIDLEEYKEFVRSYTYRDLFRDLGVEYGKY